MSRAITISLIKQLKQVRHQPIQEHAQEQDEQQVQSMGDEPMNAPNMDVTQRGEINEQHQNVIKAVVQRCPTMFSTTHQETPQTTT
jgi:hypothetical protein